MRRSCRRGSRESCQCLLDGLLGAVYPPLAEPACEAASSEVLRARGCMYHWWPRLTWRSPCMPCGLLQHTAPMSRHSQTLSSHDCSADQRNVSFIQRISLQCLSCLAVPRTRSCVAVHILPSCPHAVQLILIAPRRGTGAHMYAHVLQGHS